MPLEPKYPQCAESVSACRRHEDTRGLTQLPDLAPYWYYHTVEYAAFVASKCRGLLDQICTTSDPKIDRVMQVLIKIDRVMQVIDRVMQPYGPCLDSFPVQTLPGSVNHGGPRRAPASQVLSLCASWPSA